MSIQCKSCKGDLPTAAEHCPSCGADVPLDYATGQPVTTLEGGQRSFSGMSFLGGLLLLGGIAGAVYFLAFFDTSIAVNPPADLTALGVDLPSRVNNVGLMADRQNGIIVSVGSAIVGAVLILAGRARS